MTAIDPATRDAVADVLLDTDWEQRNSPYATHRSHKFDASCAICRGDVWAIADALAPLIARLRAEAVDKALAGVESRIRSVDNGDALGDGLDIAARIVAARRTGGEG